MTFWNIGDEEHSDPRFRAVPGGLGLYAGAGSWCMAQVRGKRGDLPLEWFIPDHFIRGWDDGRGPRIAKGLERVGIWERVEDGPLERGYRFAWIREGNTPDTIRKLRKRWSYEKSGGAKP
jgi:hypothetical protein